MLEKQYTKHKSCAELVLRSCFLSGISSNEGFCNPPLDIHTSAPAGVSGSERK